VRPTTFAAVWGMTLPTVDVRFSSESSSPVIKVTGLVSVIPYAINIFSTPISSRSRFIRACDTLDPDARPVRRRRGFLPSCASTSSSAMYMVGTPKMTVAFSARIAWTVLLTSKKSDGKKMLLPWQNEARNPRTSPKQWNNGGEQQTTSSGPRPIA
jgi:hypothetical protein